MWVVVQKRQVAGVHVGVANQHAKGVQPAGVVVGAGGDAVLRQQGGGVLRPDGGAQAKKLGVQRRQRGQRQAAAGWGAVKPGEL